MSVHPCPPSPRPGARRIASPLLFGALLAAPACGAPPDANAPAFVTQALGANETGAGGGGSTVNTADPVAPDATDPQPEASVHRHGADLPAAQLDAMKRAGRANQGGRATDPSTAGPLMYTPVVNTSFDAVPATGYEPPDSSIAAGPSDVMVAVNSTFRIFNKGGGQLYSNTLNNWFANVLPSPNNNILVFDPHVIYDPLNNRFVLVAFAYRSSDGYSQMLISVSDDNVAQGGFCNWAVDARYNGGALTSFWADYPGVGVTANTLVVSANMFNSSNAFQYSKIRVFPKSQIYNTSCPGFSYNDTWGMTDADGTRSFTMQPAVSYLGGGTTYVVNSRNGGPNQITLWSLTDSAANPPALTLTRQATLVSDTNFAIPPGAQQPGTTGRVDTGDNRLLNAYYRGSGIWTAHTVNCYGSYSCARWYNINPSNNTITQQQSFGASGYYYFFPAIVGDASGNAWMVFNRSGTSEYASIRYTGRKSTDTAGVMQGSAQLTAGQGCYGGGRWGDYNGISPDPSSTTAWAMSEYAFGTSTTCSSNTWRTRVGQLGAP